MKVQSTLTNITTKMPMTGSLSHCRMNCDHAMSNTVTANCPSAPTGNHPIPVLVIHKPRQAPETKKVKPLKLIKRCRFNSLRHVTLFLAVEPYVWVRSIISRIVRRKLIIRRGMATNITRVKRIYVPILL